MALPLAHRELTRMAKSRRFFLLRAAVPGLASLFLGLCWVLVHEAGYTGAPARELTVRSFNMVAVAFQYVVLVACVPVLTANAIAEEREEGTLGLLFLAGFRSVDVYLSKLAPALLQSLFLLWSALPLIAFAALFGAVSISAAAARMALLSSAVCGLCALGMLWSTLARHRGTALMLTMMSLVLWAFAGLGADFLLHYFLFLPSFTFDGILTPIYAMNPPTPVARWIPAVAVNLGVALVASVLAIGFLPRRLAVRPPRAVVRYDLPYGSTHRRMLRLGPAAPLLASASAGFSTAFRSPLALAAFGVLLTIIALVPFLGGMVAVLLLYSDVTSSIAQARRNGVFEDLRAASSTDREVARTIVRYYMHGGRVYAMAFGVAAIVAFLVTLAVYADRSPLVIALDLGTVWSVVFSVAYPVAAVLFFVGFAAGQVFCTVAVVCCASTSNLGTGVRHVAAFTSTVALYLLALGVPPLLQSSLLWLAQEEEVMYLTPVLFCAWSALLFVPVGWWCYRRFETRLSSGLYCWAGRESGSVGG